MSLRATVLASLLATVGLTLALISTEQWGVGRRADDTVRYKFLLEDISDRYIYQQRGRWLPSGRTPYLQEHSEYPQLATWLFGLPYLFFDNHVPEGRAQRNDEFVQHKDDTAAYFDLHHVSMGLSLFALVALSAACLARLSSSPGWALLLFLPGTAYFSFNRFDAWPAAFVALAVLQQLRGRPKAAAFALGLGAMMKWYPILLVPLFLAHNLAVERAAAESAGRSGVWWRHLPRAVIVPGLAATAALAAVLGITWLWDGGGWEAVSYVYRHHADRPPNPPSLVYALRSPERWSWVPRGMAGVVECVLPALQFAPALVLALFPVRSRRALLLGALCVVLGFAQFGKVFSPQWVCWVVPLAILLAPRSRLCLGLVIALQVLIYVQIPVLYYERMGVPGASLNGANAFWAVCDLRIALLFGFWAWSLAAFLRTVWRGEPDAALERHAAT
jgi:hypothetical protein